MNGITAPSAKQLFPRRWVTKHQLWHPVVSEDYGMARLVVKLRFWAVLTSQELLCGGGQLYSSRAYSLTHRVAVCLCYKADRIVLEGWGVSLLS